MQQDDKLDKKEYYLKEIMISNKRIANNMSFFAWIVIISFSVTVLGGLYWMSANL